MSNPAIPSTAKNNKTWWQAWRFILIPYLAVLIAGLAVIELRTGWICCTGGFGSRLPLFVAVFNWVFHPAKMEYVAASPLRADQQLRRADLTVDADLEPYLRIYLPSTESRVGWFLINDVPAGQAILPQNLTQLPAPKPESNSCVVVIRITGPVALTNQLKPADKLTLVSSNSAATYEGTVLADIDAKTITNSAADQKKPEPSGGADPKSKSPATNHPAGPTE